MERESPPSLIVAARVCQCAGIAMCRTSVEALTAWEVMPFKVEGGGGRINGGAATRRKPHPNAPGCQ